MPMGTHKQREKQEDIWIAHTELASGPGHPFYQRLNELLEAEQFDQFVEGRCAKFYTSQYGGAVADPRHLHPVAADRLFRGYRQRALDRLAFGGFVAQRRLVGIGLREDTPDHSTISRMRRRIDVETHEEVFGWVLKLLAQRGLLRGRRIGIDATTLEANAGLRSIVRRETGESYEEFLRGLAKASGLATPTWEQLTRRTGNARSA